MMDARLKEAIYRALRDYQDGSLKGDSTVVGMLDQPLTAVYDLICKAIETVQTKA